MRVVVLSIVTSSVSIMAHATPGVPAGAAMSPDANASLFEQQTRGASASTARADRLHAGVAASVRMAEVDEHRVLAHRDNFELVGRRLGVPAALLAAIASRETRGGRHLKTDGYSVFSGNRGYGMMQVDARFHRPQGGPSSVAHIEQAALILVRYRDRLAKSHSTWTTSEVLKAAVAAYNCGPSRVRSLTRMDRYTTGRDYSDDIWVRARYFAKRMGADAAVGRALEPGDVRRGGGLGRSGSSQQTIP